MHLCKLGLADLSEGALCAGLTNRARSIQLYTINASVHKVSDVVRLPAMRHVPSSPYLGIWCQSSSKGACTRGTKFWHAEWVPGGRSFLMLKRLADETQDDEVWEVPLERTPRKLDFRLPRTTLTYRLQPGGSKIAWAYETCQIPAERLCPDSLTVSSHLPHNSLE